MEILFTSIGVKSISRLRDNYYAEYYSKPNKYPDKFNAPGSTGLRCRP